MTSLINQDK